MNTGMMESLIGAANSVKRASVPISTNAFIKAKINGEESTVNRVMGYTMNSIKQAEKYNKKLEEATKDDQKENAAKVEAEKAEALAKDKIEKKIEDKIKTEELYSNAEPEQTDFVQISKEAKQYVEQQAKLAVKSGMEKIYLPTGEIQSVSDVNHSEINIVV